MPGLENDRSGIRFSPEIQLGHVLQALVMLGAIGGWALVGYMTIDKRLAEQGAENALLKQRTAAVERVAVDLRRENKEQSVEIRGSLAKIVDQISDLRTLVASQSRK